MTTHVRNPARSPAERLAPGRPLHLSGVADGAEGLVLADLARAVAARPSAPAISLAVICRDGSRMAALSRSLTFFAPDVEVLEFPAWDCLPYDRVSPHAGVVAQRMTTLARLARIKGRERPAILLATVNAMLQRVPPREILSRQSLAAAPGNVIAMSGITAWLELNGFIRASTVREAGEYAIRGGIVDLFAPGMAEPVRLDFFGDTLESIRAFDPETQRTTAELRALNLVPMAEFQLTTDTIRLFRTGYVAAFGAASPDDTLYEAVSEGRRPGGVEHWLPLFHKQMETLFDYLEGTPLAVETLAEEAAHERLAQIADYYQARKDVMDQAGGGAPYKPLPPDRLYLAEDEWRARLERTALARLSPFAAPEQSADTIDIGAHAGHNFSAERSEPNTNVFDAVKTHVESLQASGKRVVIAMWSGGSRERMEHVLAEHGLFNLAGVASWPQAQALPRPQVALAVLGLDSGFVTADVALITEEDILGERLIRPRRASKRAENFIAEVTSLSAGDVVVHVDHGIGRFVGLRAIEAAGAPHDCLEIHYAGGDKLFLPVENIELLSRYGSEEAGVELDRLGSTAWQARKSRMKNRIREIAGELIKVAAERQLREAPLLTVEPGLYDEFAARFPYDETDDQQAAISAVLEDLASGRPMDRLICGDVGFGKTEVALRAAFVAAMNGKQVAVVVPTTLLARQHFKTFSERMRDYPVNIAQASRLVSAAELAKTKKGLAEGQVDIVIGTHALLGKAIKFKDLGLIVVDEEQHFGVSHKEKLKQLRAEVHVLTLTATPIPRTLQLALSGVREMSIIATPPVDRLAVRTFVSPFDPIVVREALLRERYRGGQCFYVCPRIEDLADSKAFLDKTVPEVRVAVAHGQMPSGVLEDVMTAFYDGKFDVLLSTSIVESGLDIPTANTLIVHRADMFGLAQIYQLRGRVGRAKLRAYALLDAARQPQDHAAGRAPSQSAAIARHARRRLPARLARSRHPRRRQSPRRRAVRPHQGSRLRALSADAGRGGDAAQGRHLRAGRRQMVAADHHRHAGAHPGGLRRRPAGAARALPAAVRDRGRSRDRGVRRRARRPLRPAARRGEISPPDRRHQGAVPARQCRAHRGRPQGRVARLPRQHLLQSRGPHRLHRQARSRRPRAPGHEGRVLRRMGNAARAPQRRHRHLARARRASRRRAPKAA